MNRAHMPTNALIAEHMVANVFTKATKAEMEKTVRNNCREYLRAWMGSGKCSGLGIDLCDRDQEEWTPAQIAAYDEAKALYRGMRDETINVQIPRHAAGIIAVQKSAKVALTAALGAAKDAEVLDKAQIEIAYSNTVSAPLSSEAIIKARLVGLTSFKAAEYKCRQLEGSAHREYDEANAAAMKLPWAETIAANLLVANTLQPPVTA